MSFTTPCFIRKNTKSLREKLEELGYNLCVCTKKTGSNYWLLTYTNGEVHVIDPSDQHDFIVKVMDGSSWDIDCGKNVSLFLALAAMRDDTDENQYFVHDEEIRWINQDTYIHKGRLFKSLVDKHPSPDPDNTISKFHRATADEIIAHFKQKE